MKSFEYMDLYDNDKNLTGEIIIREKGKKIEIPSDMFIVIVLIFIQNSDGKFLVQRTSKEKGHVLAVTGGHVKASQTTLEAVCEEVKEELGVSIDDGSVQLFKTYKYVNRFLDVYYLKQDLDIDSLVLQESEVESVMWFSSDELVGLINKKELRESNVKPFLDILEVYGK